MRGRTCINGILEKKMMSHKDQVNDHGQHDYWMNVAIEQAQKAEKLGEVPIGAVLIHKDEIIGRGYNRREIDRDPMGHAEMMALRQGSLHRGAWRLNECQLYVTLEPCPMCAGALIQARVSQCIYGASDPKSGYAGSLANILQDERLNHQVKVVRGVCADECMSLLKKFFKNLRKK